MRQIVRRAGRGALLVVLCGVVPQQAAAQIPEAPESPSGGPTVESAPLAPVAPPPADAPAPATSPEVTPAVVGSGPGPSTPTEAPLPPGPAVTSESPVEAPSVPAPDDVDLDALLEDGAADAAVAEDTYRLYGFFDVGYQKYFIPESSFVGGFVPTQAGSFVVGNLNLYLDIRPAPDFRGLLEVRFTQYPDGNERAFGVAGNPYDRQSTQIYDLSAPAGSARLQWGSTFIERAWGEWAPINTFKVRVGQFLTPAGIWNVDHGPTTLISLGLPNFVSQQTIPLRQVGVQIHGDYLMEDVELGYHAYVSNGRTPAIFDYTDGKAVGGRVVLRTYGQTVRTQTGASFFHGKYDDIEKNITSFAPFRVDWDTTVSYSETSVGADFSLDADAFRLRTEGLFYRRTAAPLGHAPEVTPGLFEPNRHQWTGYVLPAYRLPWLGLEPYLYGEISRRKSNRDDSSVIASAGLNIHFDPAVQLKAQYNHVLFFDDGELLSDQTFGVFFTRFVLAF